MPIQKATREVFAQLIHSIRELSPGEYVEPCNSLMNNSIGKHVRHIIELFQCLENGYGSGMVSYDSRKRDTKIEEDRGLAISLLENITDQMDKPNKDLVMISVFGSEEKAIPIATNYYRELAYNLEHTIHHMALIRVGISEVSRIELSPEFGIAPSTLKHRAECVQ